MKTMFWMYVLGFLTGVLALFIWAWLQMSPGKETINIVSVESFKRLPFDGKWYVFWGGNSAKNNAHYGIGVQHCALDFVMLNSDDGRSYSGTGKDNSQYYCWGSPIYSIGDGVVSMVVNGIPDNNPSEMNSSMIYGNMVMVNYGKNVYGVYAHLQNDSVVLKVGDRIVAGQKLGQCGNSGNSSEPHLHFHLQSGNGFDEGGPVDVLFERINVGDSMVENAGLIKGQIVSNIQ